MASCPGSDVDSNTTYGEFNIPWFFYTHKPTYQLLIILYNEIPPCMEMNCSKLIYMLGTVFLWRRLAVLAWLYLLILRFNPWTDFLNFGVEAWNFKEERGDDQRSWLRLWAYSGVLQGTTTRRHKKTLPDVELSCVNVLWFQVYIDHLQFRMKPGIVYAIMILRAIFKYILSDKKFIVINIY